MLPDSFMMFFKKIEHSRLQKYFILAIMLLKLFHGEMHNFLSETDGFRMPNLNRSNNQNNMLLNAKFLHSEINLDLDTDYFAIILDTVSSYITTCFKKVFIEWTQKPLKRVTISRTTSMLTASGFFSVSCKIKDDDAIIIHLQIDCVLHLENVLSRLVSTEKLIRQSNNFSDNCCATNDVSALGFYSFKKSQFSATQ